MEIENIDILIEEFNKIPIDLYAEEPSIEETSQNSLIADLLVISGNLYSQQNKFNTILEEFNAQNNLRDKITHIYHRLDVLEAKLDYITKLLTRK